MQSYRTMQMFIRTCLILILLLSPLSTASGTGDAAPQLTQRDWMATLVDACGWSYGLPDEPQDPDYINILNGNRTLHLEAEEVYRQGEDNVSVLSFQNFGPFTGRGWLQGSRQATEVHLRFTLPIGGDYRLRARLRQGGHQFAIGGVTRTADAEGSFSEVMVGDFGLSAGNQEIIVTLPPGGAIDHITLSAPNLAVIAPGDGWQPDEPLTRQDVQTTLLQLFSLAAVFPTAPALVIEAEDLAQTEVPVVDIQHLGQPSGGRWLRAGPRSAEVRFPIQVPASGFYQLGLRALGDPITLSIDGHEELRWSGKSYLDDHSFEALYLFAGHNSITLSLPPGGGIDRLSLAQRQIDPITAAALLGQASDGAPTASDLDTFTSILSAFGIER